MQQQDRTQKAAEAEKVQASTLQLMASIFLILFAFFIVMNHISNQVVARAAATMDSVSSTFRKAATPEEREEAARQEVIRRLNPGDRFSDLQAILRDIVPTSPPPGDIIAGRTSHVSEIPAVAFFPAGSATIRLDRDDLIAALAQAARQPRQGERRVFEFVFGIGDGPLKALDATPSQSLATERAGALGRALRMAGAPANAVTVGIRPGPTEVILLRSAAYPEQAEGGS